MLGRGPTQRGQKALGCPHSVTAAGIGLATGSIRYHKGKKRARKQQEELSDSDGHATSQHERVNGESLPEECDEAAWRLDEAQEDLAGEADQTSRSNSPGFPGEATTLADDIMRTHRSEELPIPGGRLELPASPSADAEGSNSRVRQSLRPAPRRLPGSTSQRPSTSSIS
jgi:hypothetical protein